MTSESVYLISVLGNICAFIQFVAFLGFLWVIGVVIARLSGYSVEEYPAFSWVYTFLVALLAVMVIVFLPSRTVLWATYILPRLGEDVQVVKVVPKDVLENLRKELK